MIFGLSDKRLCADEKCSTIISVGKSTITYRAGKEGMVSFKINSDIRIKSKSAGSDLSLWGVEVNGREGYAPKQYIKEARVFVKEKELRYLVDVVRSSESASEANKLNITSSTTENEVVGTSSLEISTGPAFVNDKEEANETAASAIKSSPEIFESTKALRLEKKNEKPGHSAEANEEEQGEFVEDYEDYEENENIDERDEEPEIPQPTHRKILNVENEKVEKKDSQSIVENALKSEDNTKNNKFLPTTLPLTKNEQNVNNIKSTLLPFNDAKAISEPNENVENLEKAGEKSSGPGREISPMVVSYGKDSIVTQPSDNTNVPNERKLYPINSVPTNESNKNQQSQLKEKSSEADIVSSDETVPTEAAVTSLKSDENAEMKNERTNSLYEAETVKATVVGQSVMTEPPYTTEEAPFETKIQSGEELQFVAEIGRQHSAKLDEEVNMVSEILIKRESDDSLEKIGHVELSYHERQDESTASFPTTGSSLIEPYTESTTPLSLTDSSSEDEIYAESTLPLFLVDDNSFENFTPVKSVDSSFVESNQQSEPTVAPILADDFEKTTPLSLADSTTTGTFGKDFRYTTVVDQKDDPVAEEGGASELFTEEKQIDSVLEIEPPKVVQESTILPSTPALAEKLQIEVKEKGLFATILSTVNNMLIGDKKHPKQDSTDKDDELDKILYPDKDVIKFKKHGVEYEGDEQYCEKLGPNDCLRSQGHNDPYNQHMTEQCLCPNNSLFTSNITFDNFINILLSKILEMSELLACLIIAAAATLFFIFGYYCFCNNSREGALLSKLNQLESSLLASHKENAILKFNLMSVRQKLVSIEDNSFGSNDMVLSLKKELEEEMVEKSRLQEHVISLQKELENAADAGIELNKIVAELLSNQTGDESIISSVEALQGQLNEQQNTILDINTRLAEKSRENSELQMLVAEQSARYESQIGNLQRDNDELEAEKGSLLTRLEELKSEFDRDVCAALNSKNFEIKRLQKEFDELSSQLEAEHTKWQTSVAKVEALQECLKTVKHDPNLIAHVVDVANIRAEVFDAQRKYTTLKERFDEETDARKLAENQLEIVSGEFAKLKLDFNQAEKDKLEAQTRLEVLSNYFKDKETQLQKELSLKEALWLKQQGETTTTVDRVTAMQDEIQSLKSQNDALRVEMEAQIAAHKAQIGTLENRAHETWLAARQADRRYEESRAEAGILRRKLTALAGGNKESNVASTGDELVGAPSPLHMETPGSPLLGRLPPPPFLPPPFMGPPPPFMRLPPPPFAPPGEMRPAPLGRIMSPPPSHSGRFSPHHLDYEDYVDYEHENNWQHHAYSPPPRTYRSLSPTDSRYNYGTERDLISTYDTETDFSAPPSPKGTRKLRSGETNGSRNGSYNVKNSSDKKGIISSESENSNNSSSQQSKSKNGAGKSIV